MNWLWWILAFVSLGVPVGSLTIDRVFGIPARTQWKYWGIPSLIAFIIALLGALATGSVVAGLILWGVVAGILGSAALDIVRLFGYHVLDAFPLDMPQMFGTIAYGLAPQLQRNVIAQMVVHLSELPEQQRCKMMTPRLQAIANLDDSMRLAVVSAMQKGLMGLPEDRRQAVMNTQMALMADLPPEQRRKLMSAMDGAMSGQAKPVYAQPRGLPKVPMALARRFMEAALPQTWDEAGLPHWKPVLTGYIWHFVIGSTFAITYLLLFGSGSWALAIGWGVFVWLAMMIAMPPMMPQIKFPWWFPIVPFFAHIAMIIPFAYIALTYLSPEANAASFFGALGWL